MSTHLNPDLARPVGDQTSVVWTPRAKLVGRVGLILLGLASGGALSIKSSARANAHNIPPPVECLFSPTTHKVGKLTTGYAQALLTVSGITYGSPCYTQAEQKIAELSGYEHGLPDVAPADKSFIAPDSVTSSTPKSS